MISWIRYFTRGPGVILLVVLAIVGVGWIISRNRAKQEAKAAKSQVQRPLGQVNPKPSVDQSTAPKETILSDHKLSPVTAPTPESVAQNFQVSNQFQQRALPQLVSFYSQVAAPSPTPTPKERREPEETWLPPGVLIPCALVITIESSHINTPVLGEVIRDVYQINNGIRHLIIPAGSLVSCFASRAVRDRIEVAGTWLVVWPDGRQLKIDGIALNRQADISDQQFGIEDGTAGLQGQIVESDHWRMFKEVLGTLTSALLQSGTTIASAAVSHGIYGVTLPNTDPIWAKYLNQMLDADTGDSRYVQVPSATEFYIFPTQTTLPLKRSIDNKARDTEQDELEKIESTDPMQSYMQMQRQLRQEQQPAPAQDENKVPNFRY